MRFEQLHRQMERESARNFVRDMAVIALVMAAFIPAVVCGFVLDVFSRPAQ